MFNLHETEECCNRVEFMELNDDIGADDWLVPNKEISRRHLIKQTPRYNIYKADWFGDVLLYEPADNTNNRRRRLMMKRELMLRRIEQPTKLNYQDSFDRLKGLRLDLSSSNHLSNSPTRFQSGPYSPISDSESVDTIDSAYSSISSTPQYHTKSIKSEFEFPTGSKSSSFNYNFTHNDNNNNLQLQHEIQANTSSELSRRLLVKQVASNKPALVLNKDSYRFGTNYRDYDSKHAFNESNRKSCWRELNELRLVAHEGFMLFMGASLDVDGDEASASLVMQMNHQRAVSLYNLLHANKFRMASSSGTAANSQATDR